MGTEGWCRVACVSEFAGVCVCAYGVTKVRITRVERVWLLWRSIHVAAANGMTTGLLPITICLLCANLSQHIQVWPCPHLTLSKSATWGRAWGRKGREEKIRALTKSAALWANSEGGQLEFIRGQRQEIYTGCPGDSVGSGTNHIPATTWILIWIKTFVKCLLSLPIFPVWAFYAKTDRPKQCI